MSNYAVMPMNDYKNACDKIREKCLESDTITSGELSKKIDDVYETGVAFAKDIADTQIQDINAHLNNIIAVQERLIGGAE